jgi:hypothetical protein
VNLEQAMFPLKLSIQHIKNEFQSVEKVSTLHPKLETNRILYQTQPASMLLTKNKKNKKICDSNMQLLNPESIKDLPIIIMLPSF